MDFIKSGLNRQATDIHGLLLQAWDAARLDRKSVLTTLESRLASDLPLIDADPEKLERVFINLFLNALGAVAWAPTPTVQSAAATFVKKTGSLEELKESVKQLLSTRYPRLSDHESGRVDSSG